ncbi:iron ABC transporter permease [Maribius pontilimi]|uniref:Iron ABC transporter permease n=1 Tax=Palleronia pontilimi TaxID=1964209 RepID=A0A934IIE1_9RHOB|nr:lipocalin-like domain-containing protein [Palleronia pontilimi]MBJ3763451.1 iron ABC transporter permease [Palleronia pontilimi]
MNANRLTRRGLLSGLAVLPIAKASAQGFAGMGQAAGEFALPRPDTAITFPADHAPHPDFRIEWWYVTANLEGPDGTPYGIQWTLFRSALRPAPVTDGWATSQVWMGHAALTTQDSHFAAERFSRGGIGVAGVMLAPFEARIDDWSMSGPDIGHVRLTAAGTDFAFDLQLATDKPFILQGANGYSVKSSVGAASHYYSQPFYRVDGSLTLPGGAVEVSGKAWMDREWSSQPLAEDQSGWDWFSLHLDSGDKVMGYRLRGAEVYTASTWITAQGASTSFDNGAFSAEPLELTDVNGNDVPTTWAARLPVRGLDVTVTALNPQSWMPLTVSYWEGPVRVTGSHTGIGYLEMTGYG